MSIVYILLAVTTVANLIWMAANFAEGDALDEKESDLDKYSVYLDERANKIALEETFVRELQAQLNEKLEVKKRREEEETELAGKDMERFAAVLAAAERATGFKLTQTRNAESSLIRTLVAHKMHEEGYSYERIGRAMHRNHSTVTHLVQKMEDMLSLPSVYGPEIEMYNKMCGML